MIVHISDGCAEDRSELSSVICVIEFNQNPDCVQSDMKNASKCVEPKFVEELSSIRYHRGNINLREVII